MPQAGGSGMGPGMDGMMGGAKTFNIEVNNTFTGTGQPDQQSLKDFENGMLGVLKDVIDLV
ncbi:MAG: hypothetical protein AAGC93_27465 [Cyanobacteria bacterium P01_F01_bin.53]